MHGRAKARCTCYCVCVDSNNQIFLAGTCPRTCRVEFDSYSFSFSRREKRRCEVRVAERSPSVKLLHEQIAGSFRWNFVYSWAASSCTSKQRASLLLETFPNIEQRGVIAGGGGVGTWEGRAPNTIPNDVLLYFHAHDLSRTIIPMSPSAVPVENLHEQYFTARKWYHF